MTNTEHIPDQHEAANGPDNSANLAAELEGIAKAVAVERSEQPADTDENSSRLDHDVAKIAAEMTKGSIDAIASSRKLAAEAAARGDAEAERSHTIAANQAEAAFNSQATQAERMMDEPK